MLLLRCCFIVGTALLLTGCGGKTAPVTGTVKTKDGKASSGATVVFTDPVKRTSASGKCDTEGKYQLTSQKPGDGAPPGKYIVTIHSPSAADSSKPPPPAATTIMCCSMRARIAK